MTAPKAPGLPSVRIVNEGGGPADTAVYIDGQMVPCCRRFALEQKVRELPVLVLELYVGVVEIELPEAVLAALDATRQDESDGPAPEGALPHDEFGRPREFSRESSRVSGTDRRLAALAVRAANEEPHGP